jgi:hypothetical protein
MVRPKVYIVNQAGHDFEAAEKFGDLVSITEGNINVFRPDRSLFTIKQSLTSFTENDYLLLSGNTFGNAMAAIVAACTLRVPNLNLLVYDAKNQRYLHHRLDVSKMLFKRS